MDENQEKLLREYGVFVLPQYIDHSTYELLLEATLIRPDEQIKMFCRGDGGASRSALGMVDLIRQHGKFVGLLAGEANSSHVVVWAGCNERFVYPLAVIGIHKISGQFENVEINSQSAALISQDYETAERTVAHLMATASNMSPEFWIEAQQQSATGMCAKQFNAGEIVAMGMARPIGEFATRQRLVSGEEK